MPTHSDRLDAIYNAGERLVPGETHDRAEIVRHKSSYLFFRKIIEADILAAPEMLSRSIRILDIGCGVGHGTFMLTDIIGADVVGIDPSIESIQYAKENYAAKNVAFINCDAETFVNSSHEFDYVVSRHALEHVENGLNFALRVLCRKRLMVNVPFNEAEGNIHHLVHWIKEEHFSAYPNKEFFYEGHDGVTEIQRVEESPPNSIVCVSSAVDLLSVKTFFAFPLAAWQPEYLQNVGICALEKNVDARELNIIEKESQLESHHTNLRALEGDVKRRESWVAEKEIQLEQHHANLRDLEGEVKRREAGVAEKELQLQNHETNLNGMNKTLLAQAAAIAEQKASIANKESQLQEREIKIADQFSALNRERDAFNKLWYVRVCRRLQALVTR